MPRYRTPSAFNDLYNDFTGYAHPNYPENRTAIAQDMARVVAESATSAQAGPLIVADSVGIYVYSAEKGHRLLHSASYRAAPDSGFYEITSVSHVGPAIAYLGALKAAGDASWEKHLGPLIQHLTEVRSVNAAPMSEHWITQLADPLYLSKGVEIKNMIDYACSLAANYLIDVRDQKHDFSNQNIVDNFLNVQTDEYPVPFDTVMIGTFMLAGLKSVYALYHSLRAPDIAWQNAKIILHNLAGTNYSAGVTAGSNWLVPVIQAIAGPELDERRILILPYAPLPDVLGNDSLSSDDFEKLANGIWGAIYSRASVSEAAFPHIEDIRIPYRDPLPGDYDVTAADQIGDFIKRLKFSISSPKQMLSNTVGFWLAGEAVNKNWQLDKMDLPGLTRGLPAGIHAYPDDAPAIKQ